MNAPADVAAIREARRLEAVRRLRIIDTEPEQAFDDIVALATQICRMPVGFVGFFDEQRHWFKAQRGMDVWHVPRSGSLGEYTIEAGQPLVIPDVRADPRFAGKLGESTAYAGSYAGVPLYDPDGLAIGVLAVVDLEPRTLTVDQVGMLEALGRQVEQLFALRATLVARSDDRDQALERETRFRSVLQSLASGVVTYDHQGIITDCNPAAEHILGIPRNGLIGETPLRAPARHEDGRFFRDDERPVMVTLKYGIDVRDIVMGIERDNGTTRWLLVNSSPLWDQYSRSSGAVVTFADVSDLLMLNAQLQESLGELAKAAQERAALLSSVSHDIRAPLAAIRMMTEILEDRADAITATQRDELVRTRAGRGPAHRGRADRPGVGQPRRRRPGSATTQAHRPRTARVLAGPRVRRQRPRDQGRVGGRRADDVGRRGTGRAHPRQPDQQRDHPHAVRHAHRRSTPTRSTGGSSWRWTTTGRACPSTCASACSRPTCVASSRPIGRARASGCSSSPSSPSSTAASARYEVSPRGGARFVVSLPRRPGQPSVGVGQQPRPTGDGDGLEL